MNLSQAIKARNAVHSLANKITDYESATAAFIAMRSFRNEYPEYPQEDVQELAVLIQKGCNAVLDAGQTTMDELRGKIEAIDGESYDYDDAPDEAAVNARVTELVLKLGKNEFKNQKTLSEFANTREGAAAIARLAQSERYADLIPDKVKRDCAGKMQSLRQIRWQERQDAKVEKINQQIAKELRQGFQLKTKLRGIDKLLTPDTFSADSVSGELAL